MRLLDRKLFLTGMMGSGKSTVGRLLARWLGVDFRDLDEELARRGGLSVAEIFRRRGEAHFRRSEKRLLREWAGLGPCVIATGGGTLTDPDNRRTMEASGLVILLHADVSTLVRRLEKRAHLRPLLRGGPLRARLRELWCERRAGYESAALRVDSSGSDPESASQRALQALPSKAETLWAGRENVTAGLNLLPLLGRRLAADGRPSPSFVATHRSLYERHRRILETSLPEGFSAVLLSEGERIKSLRHIVRIYRRLAEAGADRRSPLIALGGGTIGDAVGFAAATYMRGLPLFQLPTTLLAQIDSGLGGKNGFNLAGVKNLVGTYYFPRNTYLDLAFLVTLPPAEIAAGMAEAVKAGVIADPDLLDFIEEHARDILDKKLPVLWEVMRRSVRVKLKLVASDPRERGERRKLNLGHTLAHALEAAAGFRLGHGQAVSCGLVLETRIGETLGVSPRGLSRRLARILGKFGLPTGLGGAKAVDLVGKIELDKKRRRGKTVLVLPEKPRGVGEFEIEDAARLLRMLRGPRR
ncbi:MAG: bifunctional shikimate kinase/3-dehydroquinate synthase [Elusimicrobia bacterium]|nr:bifunctional shikimate kinase/3-dehydroquinate synthase [Elusimicrobiota bacterium]